MANQMYPWVGLTKGVIGGKCPHDCLYCFVETLKEKFPAVAERYSGSLRLIEKELSKSWGKGKVIFVQSCGDLFADAVPGEWIEWVLAHCRDYPDNIYLFQTKNPERFLEFVLLFPKKAILGTTIESDTWYPEISKAPSPAERALAMFRLKGYDKMVSIEPVMDFSLEMLVDMIRQINPKFVSIGADSKKHGLKEPGSEKVRSLINKMEEFTEVRIKDNLGRILSRG